MDLNYFQVVFLAFVQGITEFLPISSSAHLIIPGELFAWEDQGQAFDVAVHVGSLFAVIFFFRQDIKTLSFAWVGSLFGKGMNDSAKMAWFLAIATVPAGFVGVMFKSDIEVYLRSLPVIAFTSIFFGLVLLAADKFQGAARSLDKMTLKDCIIIGMFQALALIPGTSRSGITITAGLFCNLSRTAASRFSFLLAIPVIAGSGTITAMEVVRNTDDQQLLMLLCAVVVSALVSLLAIHYFLQWVEKIGFMPFVIYRVAMGLALLSVYYLAG